MKVLNFGSLNIDYTYRVPHMTQEGETQAAFSLERYPGGKGLNQSIALARAGAEVFHAGAVGEDGRFLLDLLRESGVDVRFVEEHTGRSGHAVIQVDAHGRNGILIFGGANREIGTEQIACTLSNFTSEDVLLLQNEISGMEQLLALAHQKGMRTVLTPSPMDAELLRSPLEYVSLLAVNESEAAALCGAEAGALGTLPASLAKRFPTQDILFTMGAGGAYFLPAGGRPIFEPAKRVNAVDTTGAGDTFLGFFLASYLNGAGAEQALRLATAAAALCVLRPDAAASIPHRNEIGPL